VQAEVVETISSVDLGGSGRGAVGLGVTVGGAVDQSGSAVGKLSSLVNNSAGDRCGRQLGSPGTRAGSLVDVGVVRLVKGTEVGSDGKRTVDSGVLAELSEKKLSSSKLTYAERSGL
jgi:hypothetical protein